MLSMLMTLPTVIYLWMLVIHQKIVVYVCIYTRESQFYGNTHTHSYSLSVCLSTTPPRFLPLS